MADNQTTPRETLAQWFGAEGTPPDEVNRATADELLAYLAERGMEVVPRVPTKDMLITGAGSVYGVNECARIWQRMVDASNA